MPHVKAKVFRSTEQVSRLAFPIAAIRPPRPIIPVRAVAIGLSVAGDEAEGQKDQN